MERAPTKVVGQRVGAFVLDSLVGLGISAVAWFALTGRLDASTSRGGGFVIGDTRYAFTNSTNRAIWIILVVLVTLAIFVILPGLRGTSPGKSAVGIRVVDAEGKAPGLGRALIRWVVWIVVDNFPYFIPGLVGFVVALTSEGNRRVGDMAAGTWVVRKEAAGRPIAELLVKAAPAAVPWQAPAQAEAPGPPGAPGPPPPAAQPAPAQPAGWYADPHGQARLRWWDGASWTENVSN